MKKNFKITITIVVMLMLAVVIFRAIQSKIEVVGTEEYMVSRGDTLWDIAKTRINKNIDIRDYIDLIYESNEKLTPNIKPGQVINLPILSGVKTTITEDIKENATSVERVTENTNMQTQTSEVYEPKPTIKDTSLAESTALTFTVPEEPIETGTEENEFIGNFRITAYCSCKKCCGKWADNRPNGIVYGASGKELKAGVSVASPLPFNTKLYIDGLGEYVVQDRTATWVVEKYGEGIIDIYFDSHEEASKFGLKHLDVYRVG